MIQPEQKVQQAVIKFLKPYTYENGGNIILHVRSGNSGEPKGAADIWICVNGLHVEIECKAPGGEQSADQERWERICKQCHTPYLLVDNLRDFKIKIKEYINL